MVRLTFSEEDRQQLQRERFEHPHPRVQRRMEVLWLISGGETYSSAARLGGVSDATIDRYVALYREGGIEALKQFEWEGPQSELAAHQTSLEKLFQAEFLAEKLEPLLDTARGGTGQVFCVDAAHFVQGAFLRCLWCLRRLFIRGASGRQRDSVLGA